MSRSEAGLCGRGSCRASANERPTSPAPSMSETPNPISGSTSVRTDASRTDRFRKYGTPQTFSTMVAAKRRSEEHTSELQSLAYLVCRLLLEKKKKNSKRTLSHVELKRSTYGAWH